MLRIEEAVPHIQEMLRTIPGDIEVVAWSDGEIVAVPRSLAEIPEPAEPRGSRHVIARFLPAHLPLSDQEIAAELRSGLAATG